jgi:hypothetical protein
VDVADSEQAAPGADLRFPPGSSALPRDRVAPHRDVPREPIRAPPDRAEEGPPGEPLETSRPPRGQGFLEGPDRRVAIALEQALRPEAGQGERPGRPGGELQPEALVEPVDRSGSVEEQEARRQPWDYPFELRDEPGPILGGSVPLEHPFRHKPEVIRAC